MRRILMPSRRRFLKQSAAAVSSVMAANLRIARSAHVAGSDLLRVGLIGCGGRGTGGAVQALSAAPNCKLVAMGDVFEDRLSLSLEQLQKSEAASKGDVPEETRRVVLHVSRNVLASGVRRAP